MDSVHKEIGNGFLVLAGKHLADLRLEVAGLFARIIVERVSVLGKNVVLGLFHEGKRINCFARIQLILEPAGKLVVRSYDLDEFGTITRSGQLLFAFVHAQMRRQIIKLLPQRLLIDLCVLSMAGRRM